MPAFTTADAAAIRQAIATGEKKVRFADGSETEYRSMLDLQIALAMIERDLAAATDNGATAPGARLGVRLILAGKG